MIVVGGQIAIDHFRMVANPNLHANSHTERKVFAYNFLNEERKEKNRWKIHKPQIGEHWRSYFQFDVQWLDLSLGVVLFLVPAANALGCSLRMDETTRKRCTWRAVVVMTSMAKCSRSTRPGRATILRDALGRPCSKRSEFDTRGPSADPKLLPFPVQHPISMDRRPKR